MRLLAVESCGAFAQALGREDAVNSLLPIVQKFAQVCSSLVGCAKCARQHVPLAHADSQQKQG